MRKQLFFVCLFSLLTLSSAYSQNLLKNPSFDLIDAKGMPLDWEISLGAGNKVELDTEVFHSAPRAIKFTRVPIGNNYTGIGQSVEIKGGEEYRISAWIQSRNVQPRMFVWFYDKEGKHIGTSPRRDVQPNDEFQYVTLDVKAPAGAVRALLRVEVYVDAVAGEFWVDDLEFSKVEKKVETKPSESLNLIKNPGFDKTDDKGLPSDWVISLGAGNKAELDSKIIHSAPFALKFTRAPIGNNYSGMGQTVELKGGEEYLVAAWIQSRAVQPRMFVWFYDEEGKHIGTSPRKDVQPSDQFQYVSLAIKAPAEAVKAQLRIEVYVDAIAGEFWVDDVSFNKIEKKAEAPTSKNVNIVKNSGFEEKVGDRPAEWDFNIRGKCSAMLDTDAYKGKRSVKIVKVAEPGSNVVACATNIPVKPNTTYTLSAYVKAEPGSPARLFGYFYNDAGEYLGYSKRAEVKSDELGWHRIGTLIEIPSGTTLFQLRFEMYGEGVQGIAWIDEVWMSEGISVEHLPKKENNLSMVGSLSSLVRITPEYGLQTENNIRLDGSFSVGMLQQTATFLLRGIWQEPGYGTPFWQPDNRLLNNRFYNFKVHLNGPLFEGLSPSNITLGQLGFSYSPYTVNMSYELGHRNAIRKGALIEGLQIANNDISAFLVWDGKPQNWVWGTKDIVKNGPWRIENIFVQGRKESIDSYSNDTVFSTEIDYRQKSQNINFLFARNWKGEGLSKDNIEHRHSDLLKLEGEYKLAQNASLIYIFRDFGYQSPKEKFDPWYRDSIDRNLYDNRLTAPLDLYLGYRGYSLGFSANASNTTVHALFENYQDRASTDSLNLYPTKIKGVVLRGQTQLWGITTRGTIELKNKEEYLVLGQPNKTDLHRFEIRCNRDLKPIGGQPARLIFRWEEELWPKVNKKNEMFYWTQYEIRLESRLASGPFQGLRWSTFILGEPVEMRKRFGVTLDYNTPSGLLLKARFAWPNFHETRARDYYDPFGRLVGPDNCFELTGNVSF